MVFLGSDCMTHPPKWCQLSLSLGCSASRTSSTPDYLSFSPVRFSWLVFAILCHLISNPSKVVTCWRQIPRNPKIHGLLSQSPENRCTWEFPRYPSPSRMTLEAWMICHHPVYHGDDDWVAVKTLTKAKKKAPD
jgi:hypothetical protein